MTDRPAFLKTRPLLLMAMLAVTCLGLAAASAARAADSVYWANFSGESLAFANLAGGSGGLLDTTPAAVEEPNGLTIDSANGRIYWISGADGTIHYASLAGGGGGELSTAGAAKGFPVGMAIDPALGRIYWANAGGEKISYANLDGSGGGDLDTTGATVSYPLGVAIDQSSGRVYWINDGASEGISYANLTGGGGGNLEAAGATVEDPGIPAIDSAAGKIYWGNYTGNSISYASLNGSGGGNLNTAGATVAGPAGIAIDPAAGRVYWANETAGKISYAALNGSGGADLDTTGATLEAAAFLMLLKAPSALTAPAASGTVTPGTTLSCTAATWAPDLLGAFLYQAPQSTSLQWLKDGAPIAGATTADLKASSVGAYSCQSTATNHAGSSSQTSAPVGVFQIGKAKLNRKKGTALLPVQVPGAGVLTLTGKTLARQSKKTSGTGVVTVKLLVKAKGKAKKALAKKGKAKVAAKIAFTPTGGTAGAQTKSVVLRAKPKKR